MLLRSPPFSPCQPHCAPFARRRPLSGVELLQHRRPQHASTSKDIKAAPQSNVTRSATFLYEDYKTCTPDHQQKIKFLRELRELAKLTEAPGVKYNFVLR